MDPELLNKLDGLIGELTLFCEALPYAPTTPLQHPDPRHWPCVGAALQVETLMETYPSGWLSDDLRRALRHDVAEFRHAMSQSPKSAGPAAAKLRAAAVQMSTKCREDLLKRPHEEVMLPRWPVEKQHVPHAIVDLRKDGIYERAVSAWSTANELLAAIHAWQQWLRWLGAGANRVSSEDWLDTVDKIARDGESALAHLGRLVIADDSFSPDSLDRVHWPAPPSESVALLTLPDLEPEELEHYEQSASLMHLILQPSLARLKRELETDPRRIIRPIADQAECLDAFVSAGEACTYYGVPEAKCGAFKKRLDRQRTQRRLEFVEVANPQSGAAQFLYRLGPDTRSIAEGYQGFS